MLTRAIALKEDQLQFISNADGDVPALNPSGFGLYFQDTRFLNRFEFTVNGLKPLLLTNSVNKHYIATFQLINPPLVLADGKRVRQQTISMRRSRFVTGDGLFERIGFLNCNHFEIELELELSVDADFRDMFAVREFAAQRSSGEISVAFGEDGIRFTYKGRDRVRRSTEVTFDRPPDAVASREARFCLRLAPQQSDAVVVRVQPKVGRKARTLTHDFDTELAQLADSYRQWDDSSTRISTDNQLFDRELLRASRYDMRSLLDRTPEGVVPDAGIPWYAVPFGRDAIITALQTLPYNPSIAEGTLRFLAAHQGTEVDPYREEEPGKIMHELRRGELARLGEIPHTPYYGTIDATPLFVVLFVETLDWTYSESLYRDLLPSVKRAVEWMDRYGDMDGDGYLEYIAHQSGGVVNQGWKDSADSVQYQDGRNVQPPVALVEVQGYVYQAKMGLARILRAHGDDTLAPRLESEADCLKERFNRDFWMEDEAFYALALDGEKRQIRSVTSNVGHCLWSGICDANRIDAVADRLLAPDMFSGWGIRTLSQSSPNYNPMSYHNGSIWPHDTALIALGLRRAGRPAQAARVVSGLIEAGFRFSDARLPELFCGFGRDHRFNSSPAAYVVSCSPQAWAAGSIFMLLQSMLDLRPDLPARVLRVAPAVPSLFGRILMENMRVGKDRVDLEVERQGDQTRVGMTSRKGLRLLRGG